MTLLKNILTIACCVLLFSLHGQYDATWESLDQRQTPEWFKDAKFGIFLHWGVYSVPSWATKSKADGFGSGYAEWYWQRLKNKDLKIHQDFADFHQANYGSKNYQDLVQSFNAELFDPAEWANIFKNSGAKYVVLTSKHHEGFALWPSIHSWNWNAGDVGPHRDLAGDLSKAVKNIGLKMGFYYSLYEWYNPNYKNHLSKYVDEYMVPQMKELVNTYEPDILWPDGEWEQTSNTWKSKEFLAWLYNKSTVKNTIAVNDRWGNDTRGIHGGFATSEYGHGGEGFEETNDGFTKPWEECRGMGSSFGYNRNESLENYQTGEQLVHQLIDIVSKGGNLLLNIGPTADGRIPVIMQERLSEIGAWLAVNGEAIYETEVWPEAPKKKNVYFTKKENTINLITTKWQDVISFKWKSKPKSIKMLGHNGKIDFTFRKGILKIKAPKINPSNMPCGYGWVYTID